MNADARPQVLVLLGCLWPGNDASGPNQSFRAMAQALSGEFAFRFIARAGPPGAGAVARPGWHDAGFAPVAYCADGALGARGLGRLLAATPHDLLWLNSVFDRTFTWPALARALAGRGGRRPMLLSPRGEMSAGALAVRGGRKAAFLGASAALGLWRPVAFHATSAEEAADMRARLGALRPVFVAPNIRLPIDTPHVEAPDGRLRLCFVARIVPHKRLHFALQVLARVRCPVTFDILGPAEDKAYFARCEALMAALPPHVEARWHGAADAAGVRAALGRADLMFLPTAGENFGHAIFEALSCGVPALVSDRTPWRGLAAAQAGHDLPPDDPAPFVAAIEAHAALPPASRAAWQAGARRMARRWERESGAVAATRAMLEAMLRGSPAP